MAALKKKKADNKNIDNKDLNTIEEEQQDTKNADNNNDCIESDIDKLKKEIKELKEENDDLSQAKIRQAAEFDNFRKRTAKEQLLKMLSANENLVTDLLPIFDNFERSLAKENKTENIEDIYKGIEMIFTQFKDVLEKAGLKKDEPLGEEFNPDLHDAMLQQHSDEYEENQIMQVIMNGYKLNERVIKHAQVIVSKGKEEK